MFKTSQLTIHNKEVEDVLEGWRTRAVTVILYVLSVVALPAVITSAIYYLNRYLLSLAILIIVLYVLIILMAIFKHWDYKLRASAILFIGYTMAVSALTSFGITGAGTLYLLVMPILAVILIGRSTGWITTALSILIYGIICVITNTGLLANWQDNEIIVYDIESWITRGITFLMLLILVIALLMRMHRFLLNTLKAERRLTTELEQTYDATLVGWARTLELRDIETAGHCHRVNEISRRLASKTGLANENMVDMHRGSLLHDIGKMGIPDSILLKPGKLTDDERKLMQKHTTYAYELLAHIPYLRKALDIPYCHHEKWDGTGYPRGLKGKEIPLSARIFSVVDVYDALISDRPYRTAWPKETALAYIRERAGTEFDPAVVDVFVKLTNEEMDTFTVS